MTDATDSGSSVTPSAGEVPGEHELEPGHPATASRRLELVAAGVALLACLALVFGARGIELRTEAGGIDPRWWPTLLGALGAVLAAALLAQAAARPPADREDLQSGTAEGVRRLLLALGGSAALVFLWPLLGFVPASALFLAVLTYLFGGRGWGTLILFPAVTAGCLYLLFSVALEVPL